MQDTADADACLVFGDSTPHAIMSCLAWHVAPA
eukprot:CAMPEP_0178486026 /NCGR_PEP_ID=MMETSP0696-20121128/8587_1 /TAXON_ID=265572 /ORGANISM="Extubocellulus spinifer, Strain CCMP396" /LENGTH=32 /DNA_ID= /DNA_START= /DNA_END= /DNA_ORIENTATION=